MHYEFFKENVYIFFFTTYINTLFFLNTLTIFYLL